jgi:hypothetical protein
MNKVLVFILTKTGVIRWIGNFVAAWLVAQGVINDDAQTQVVGAIVAIITGLLNQAVEAIKSHETKKLQRVINANNPDRAVVKRDGLAGPKTRAALMEAIKRR